MSCKNKKIISKGEETLFEKKEDYLIEKPCPGCQKKIAQNHNGMYVKIMDWVKGSTIKFVDILSKQ
jgi:hypothetical protein